MTFTISQLLFPYCGKGIGRFCREIYFLFFFNHATYNDYCLICLATSVFAHCTMFFIHVVFVSTYVFNLISSVSSEESVTQEALLTSHVPTPSESIRPGILQNPGNLSRTVLNPYMALEGGGTAVAVAKQSAVAEVVSTSVPEADAKGALSTYPTTVRSGAVDVVSFSTHAPSNTSQKLHTLADETKHTDIDRLLDTSEGGSQTKMSSVVARKGAPPEAPDVVEDDSSAEVQSLFGDDTKNVSAVSVCSDAMINGKVGSKNCSQNEQHDKSSPASSAPTTVVAAASTSAIVPMAASGNNSGNHSETAVGKQTGNITVLKPAVLHELGSSAVHNSSAKNPSASQNITNANFSRKKFKPATTSDIDESKEQSFPTDTPASKGDYIIPIIGIILSVPMVVILFMFFYKRSAEFWERRHYKRMDFLIDGMYND